jgi:hypothetical protein
MKLSIRRALDTVLPLYKIAADINRLLAVSLVLRMTGDDLHGVTAPHREQLREHKAKEP